MIVRDIALDHSHDLVRLTARVIREFTQREQTVYVETDRRDLLAADPNGFLLATFLPAWMEKEKRLLIEGELCPQLVENLNIAASVFRHWFRDFGRPPVIEGERQSRVPGNRAATFLSGGIDSMYSIHELTSRLPLDNQDRPQAGLLLDYRGWSLSDREADLRFDECRRRVGTMLESKGLAFEWMRSNMRAIQPSGRFWTRRYHGAMLGAMAHFASAKYGKFYIASSVYHDLNEPWGSHPITDPLYSSFHMALRSHGSDSTKSEKVAALTNWPEGLRQVHVCVSKSAEGRNCGRCRKCQVVKLYLLAHGAEGALAAFDHPEITVEDVRNLKASHGWVRVQSLEVLEQVRKRGIENEVFAELAANANASPVKRQWRRLIRFD